MKIVYDAEKIYLNKNGFYPTFKEIEITLIGNKCSYINFSIGTFVRSIEWFYYYFVRKGAVFPILKEGGIVVKCMCGRFITQQARVLARVYQTPSEKCIHCLSEVLCIPYEELLNQYMGIYDCRPCAQDKKKEELRRKLLGLG